MTEERHTAFVTQDGVEYTVRAATQAEACARLEHGTLGQMARPLRAGDLVLVTHGTGLQVRAVVTSVSERYDRESGTKPYWVVEVQFPAEEGTP